MERFSKKTVKNIGNVEIADIYMKELKRLIVAQFVSILQRTLKSGLRIIKLIITKKLEELN
jgi:hypothetical protein